MRPLLLAAVAVTIVGCSGGGDAPAGLDSTPLAMTPTAVDAERTAIATVFGDVALRALIPVDHHRHDHAVGRANASPSREGKPS